MGAHASGHYSRRESALPASTRIHTRFKCIAARLVGMRSLDSFVRSLQAPCAPTWVPRLLPPGLQVAPRQPAGGHNSVDAGEPHESAVLVRPSLKMLSSAQLCCSSRNTALTNSVRERATWLRPPEAPARGNVYLQFGVQSRGVSKSSSIQPSVVTWAYKTYERESALPAHACCIDDFVSLFGGRVSPYLYRGSADRWSARH